LIGRLLFFSRWGSSYRGAMTSSFGCCLRLDDPDNFYTACLQSGIADATSEFSPGAANPDATLWVAHGRLA
jgi:hypothetical protein